MERLHPAGVTQQPLNHRQRHTRFHQVRREGMAQHIRPLPANSGRRRLFIVFIPSSISTSPFCGEFDRAIIRR
jgi:hypothetical protein